MTKNVFLISDTHFGHGNCLNFLREDGVTKLRHFSTQEEMDETMIENWNNKVKPTDKIYHLGDVVINKKFMHIMGRLNGDKVLIKGNHDIFPLEYYTPYFRDIRAYHVLSRMILSHVPVHRSQINRFKVNVHGHLHDKIVRHENGEKDTAYFSVCVEHTNYTPVELSEVIKAVS